MVPSAGGASPTTFPPACTLPPGRWPWFDERTSWLIRRHLRHRWLALVPIALVLALGATGTFVALGAAERTAGAYARYLERADVGDVVLNPSLNTVDADRAVRSLPGIRSVTSDVVLLGGIDDRNGVPRTVAEVTDEGYAISTLGSADGRYSSMDRPVLTAGRLPSAADQVLVNRELAAARRLGVGDRLTVSLWDPRDDILAEPDDVVAPIGVEHVRVSGVAMFADEVLPDGLFPRQRMLLSPELTARYDCLPEVPAATASEEEALAQMLPPGCAATYRYYSLDLEQGSSGVPAVQAAFLEAITALNAELPPALVGQEATYFLVATTTSEERRRVERSTYPTVAALVVLGAAAAAITMGVGGLAVARELRRTEGDQRQWRSLGLGARGRVAVVTVPLAAATALALALALVLARALSPVGPVGLVRSVDPAPGRGLGAWVGAAALALTLAAALGLPALALKAARRAARSVPGRRETVTVSRLLRLPGRPEVGEGVRAAYASPGAGLVVATCGLALSALVAAMVFGASLSALVSTPATYGWPWDLAAMTGYGYGDLDLEAVERSLLGRPDVAGWSTLGFTGDVTLDGEPVLAVVALEVRNQGDLTVAAGRLPRTPEEVAVGSGTAAALDISVGDEVEVVGDAIAPRRSTVTGVAVLPSLGPFQADRTGPGRGIVLPASVYPPELVADGATFVGIDLEPGTEPDTVLDELGDDILAWDAVGFPPFEYADPVRPAEIVNAEAMRVVPIVVGGLLAASAVVGLAVAVALSVRARRGELAILRSLGFTGRQLRTSVRAQATATMVAAVVVGAPLGVAAGRLTWRAFASGLGVVTAPSAPLLALAGIVVGALLVALAAAAAPARWASRVDPSAGLRAE